MYQNLTEDERARKLKRAQQIVTLYRQLLCSNTALTPGEAYYLVNESHHISRKMLYLYLNDKDINPPAGKRAQKA